MQVEVEVVQMFLVVLVELEVDPMVEQAVQMLRAQHQQALAAVVVDLVVDLLQVDITAAVAVQA